MNFTYFAIAAALFVLSASPTGFAKKDSKRYPSSAPNAKIFSCTDDFGFMIDGKTAIVTADGVDSGNMQWKDDSNDSVKAYSNKKATLTVDFIILTGTNSGTVRFKLKGQKESIHEGCELAGAQG